MASDKWINQEEMLAVLRKWCIKAADEHPMQDTILDKCSAELSKLTAYELVIARHSNGVVVLVPVNGESSNDS